MKLWSIVLLIIAACNGKHSNDAKKTEGPIVDSASRPAIASADSTASTNLQQALTLYDLKDKEPESFELVMQLREISGIAFTSDGRLFAEQDERGTIFQLDTSSGEVIKEFYLGKDGGVKGDFEDIAIVGSTFYLMRSDGDIFEFTEGGDGATVEYKEYQTSLTKENNVEGLCYDPTTNALLLACKYDPGKGYDGYKAVYSFSLKTKQLDPKPRFLIPIADVEGETGKDRFNPSAIVRHPKSGTFLILASSGSAIVELSIDGKVLGVMHLKRSIHTQPEGIAIGPDMTLYISDEGREGKARLTKYPMQHIQER